MICNILQTQLISYNLIRDTPLIMPAIVNMDQIVLFKGVADDCTGKQKFSFYQIFQRKDQKLGAK